jgi:hypothetical protein
VIVIHVGLKKAGSSSIQDFMADNENALRDIGVDYARIGRKERAEHHNIAREIVDKLGNFDPSYGSISELSEYWHDATGDTLVISSEGLEEAEIHQAARIRDTLGRARPGEDFRIVLILRDLLDQVQSSYAQRAKNGVVTHDFDVFFEERMRERRVHYFDAAKRWAAVFGWDSIQARLLDRDHLINGDLIDDFLAVCNLEPQAVMPSLTKRLTSSNASPGWKVLESLRALFSGRHDLPAKHLLAKRLNPTKRRKLSRAAMRAGEARGWNQDRGRYFTHEQAQRCFEVYNSNIAALNVWLPTLIPAPRDLAARSFIAREFLPGVERITAGELRSFYDDVAEELLEKRKKSGSDRSDRDDSSD